MHIRWMLLIGLGLWLEPAMAQAQGPWGGHSHGQPVQPEMMSREEAEQRFRRSEFYLAELDTNHNGVIEAEEVDGRKRYFADRLLQRAGLEANYPIAVYKVREGLQRYYQSVTIQGTGMPGTPGAMPGGYATPGQYPPSGPDPNAERRRMFEQLYAELRHLDANNNGTIEAEEITGGGSHSHREVFERVMAKAGMPATPPVRLDQVRDRLMAAFQLGPPGSSAPGGPVPGFGVVSLSRPAVPGFGPVPTAPPMGTLSRAMTPGMPPGMPPAGGSLSSPPKTPEEAKVREYAKSLLTQFDKNKDGVLQKEEWSQMREGTKHADRNGDGVITLEELTNHMLQFSSQRSRSHSDGDRSSSAASGKAPPYRLSTALERLPPGLPSWYMQKDADGDGQIAMAEFATEWTEQKAGEFARYDLDGDGFITPKECLAVEKKK